MRRIYPTTLVVALVGALGWGGIATAQTKPASGDDDDEMTFEPEDPNAPKKKDEGPAEGEPEMEGETVEGPSEGEALPDITEEPAADSSAAAVKADQKVVLSEKRVAWQDILVVIRKPFLKVGRVELLPSWGVTMNDNIIQHVQFSAQLNYWL